MKNEDKKIIIDKKIPIWLVPIRSIYRAVRSLMSNKLKLKQLSVNEYELLVWANEDIGKSLMLARRHEEEEVSFFERFIGIDAICIDVGANIGYYTMLFAKLSGANGVVYAIEPLRKNYLSLELSAEINQYHNIQLFCGVASSSEGEVNISIPQGDGAYAHIASDSSSGERLITVQSTTLDSLAATYAMPRIDAIKIDVEGAELLVLQGATGIFANIQLRPRVVMIELVSDMLKAHAATIPMVLEFMAQYGYQPYKVTKDGHLSPYTTADMDNVFNVFFKRNN